MTPKLVIRSFTNDQYILDKVFYANFYCLKAVKDKRPIVLDLGAHCGYFSFAALALGARRVYSFEPFIENYRILLLNLGGNSDTTVGETIPYQLGVYTEDSFLKLYYPKLDGLHFNFANVSPVELNEQRSLPCPCLSLDKILSDSLIPEKIDILKISIGYGEMDILLSSKTLGEKISHICGETDQIESESKAIEFKRLMAEKGYTDSFISEVEGEEGKILFHFSKTKCEEAFDTLKLKQKKW